MAPAQISLANAYATILAAVYYAAALVVFVIYDNSDAGRVAGSGLQLELTYFVLYFLYFGLYLGFVTALTKLAPVSRRIVLGLVAAIIVWWVVKWWFSRRRARSDERTVRGTGGATRDSLQSSSR